MLTAPHNYRNSVTEIQLLQLKNFLLAVLLCLALFLPAQTHGQLFRINDPNIETSGDAALILLPASALATTFLLKDKQGTGQFTKSFLLNLAVTGIAKAAINKERPLEGGDYAFPSGHTSVAFQSASFYHRRYGFKYSIPAYVVAGYTGYTRWNADRHDGWDILAGAVVGIGSTWFFTTPREKEQLQVSFSGYEEGFIMGFTYSF